MDQTSKWSFRDDHWSARLLTAVHRLLSQDLLCDTTIVSLGGESLRAHSCILAGSSPVLAAALRGNTSNTGTPKRINLDWITFKSLKVIVGFVYSGELELEEACVSEVEEVGRAAKALQIETLASWCDGHAAVKGSVVKGSVVRGAGAQNEPQTVEHDADDGDDDEEAEDGDDDDDDGGGGDDIEVSLSQSDPVPEDQDNVVTETQDVPVSQPLLELRKKSNRRQRQPRDSSQKLGRKPPKPRIPGSLATKVPCPQCDKVLASSKILKSHLLVHSDARPFKCTQCDLSFRANSNLTRHLRCHTGLKPFPCNNCGMSFTRLDILKRHQLSHAPDRRPIFKCSFCEKTFFRELSLKSHESYHRDPHRNQCSICHKTYTDAKSLKDHVLTHSAEKNFGCDTCGLMFINTKRLHQHQKVHLENRLREHECPTCHKRFYNKQSLVSHQRIHSGVQPYQCEVCLRRFSQYSNCYAHQKLHTGDKPFICEICGTAFAKRAHLEGHLQIHREDNPFQCKSCPKTFKQMKNLKVHELVHATERPTYQCDVCGKRLVSNRGMLTHQRMHRKQNVFPCRGCPKRFTNNFNRKKHEEKLHHLRNLPVNCIEVSAGGVPTAFVTKSGQKESLRGCPGDTVAEKLLEYARQRVDRYGDSLGMGQSAAGDEISSEDHQVQQMSVLEPTTILASTSAILATTPPNSNPALPPPALLPPVPPPPGFDTSFTDTLQTEDLLPDLESVLEQTSSLLESMNRPVGYNESPPMVPASMHRTYPNFPAVHPLAVSSNIMHKPNQ